MSLPYRGCTEQFYLRWVAQCASHKQIIPLPQSTSGRHNLPAAALVVVALHGVATLLWLPCRT